MLVIYAIYTFFICCFIVFADWRVSEGSTVFFQTKTSFNLQKRHSLRQNFCLLKFPGSYPHRIQTVYLLLLLPVNRGTLLILRGRFTLPTIRPTWKRYRSETDSVNNRVIISVDVVYSKNTNYMYFEKN